MAVEGIVAALRGVGGPQLYRRNAFRVTGLPTDADRKTVRHRQRRVLAALEAGADIDLGHDLPVGTEAVRAAFDEILENPYRRLVDELFWLWGTGSACECTGTVHADHDEAVRAHSAALDLETRDGRLTGNDLAVANNAWQKAARLWGTVLRRNGFWNHIRARVANLDERQLDESVVAVLREQVPLTLLQPLIDLATEKSGRRDRLIDRVRSWPGVPDGTADHLLEEAATPHYEAADTAITEASDVLRGNKPERAAGLVTKNVLPILERLESLVPHTRHRRTARVRDRAALVLNNCATVLIERSGPLAQTNARRWLGTALELASDSQSLQTIRANQATLNDIVSSFQIIEQRVSELLAAGRPDVARLMLLDLKRKLNGSAGSTEIDRLLERVDRAPRGLGVATDDFERQINDLLLGARPSRYQTYDYSPTYSGGYSEWDATRDWWRWNWRKVAGFLAVAAVAVAMFFFWPRGDEGTFFAPKIGDNEEPGTCIATKEGWTDDEGRDEVPVVACTEEHWAEVLGYPALGDVPSPSPGQDQITALAEFECGMLLAGQSLATEFTTTAVAPEQARWNTDDNGFENYATCLAHRADDEPIFGSLRSDSDTESAGLSVQMGVLDGGPPAGNAPYGTCIRDNADLMYDDLPIVRCDQYHWAEILAYVELYEPGTEFPGEAKASTDAQLACASMDVLPPGMVLSARWPSSDLWDAEEPVYAVCLAHQDNNETFTGGVR